MACSAWCIPTRTFRLFTYAFHIASISTVPASFTARGPPVVLSFILRLALRMCVCNQTFEVFATLLRNSKKLKVCLDELVWSRDDPVKDCASDNLAVIMSLETTAKSRGQRTTLLAPPEPVIVCPIYRQSWSPSCNKPYTWFLPSFSSRPRA